MDILRLGKTVALTTVARQELFFRTVYTNGSGFRGTLAPGCSFWMKCSSQAVACIPATLPWPVPISALGHPIPFFGLAAPYTPMHQPQRQAAVLRRPHAYMQEYDLESPACAEATRARNKKRIIPLLIALFAMLPFLYASRNMVKRRKKKKIDCFSRTEIRRSDESQAISRRNASCREPCGSTAAAVCGDKSYSDGQSASPSLLCHFQIVSRCGKRFFLL